MGLQSAETSLAVFLCVLVGYLREDNHRAGHFAIFMDRGACVPMGKLVPSFAPKHSSFT